MSKNDPEEKLEPQAHISFGTDFYRQAFHVATVAAAGVIALMVTFMGSVWSDKAAAQITMKSIRICASALIPYIIISTLLAFNGQTDRYSTRWLTNHQQTLAAYLVLILVPLGWGLWHWSSGLGKLLGN